MSAAAEAVPPEDGPGAYAGEVIRMADHHSRAPRVAQQRRRRARMTLSPEQQLAEHLEALFHHYGRSLTDKPTAQAYDITLDAVRMMLGGALADGTVDDGQHRTLVGMLDGMRNAPGLV